MVLEANTVIDPGAVMIKSFNAFVADGTVAGARRANSKTVRTQLRGV